MQRCFLGNDGNVDKIFLHIAREPIKINAPITKLSIIFRWSPQLFLENEILRCNKKRKKIVGDPKFPICPLLVFCVCCECISLPLLGQIIDSPSYLDVSFHSHPLLQLLFLVVKKKETQWKKEILGKIRNHQLIETKKIAPCFFPFTFSP